MGGTSALIGFVYENGERKGSFSEYDGHPRGTGNHIIKFLQSLKPEEMPMMAQRISDLKWVERDDDVNDENVITAYTRLSFHAYPMRNDPNATCCHRAWWSRLIDKRPAQFGGLLEGFERHRVHALPFILQGKLCHSLDDRYDNVVEWTWYLDFYRMTLRFENSSMFFGEDQRECFEARCKVSFETLMEKLSFFEGFTERMRAWADNTLVVS